MTILFADIVGYTSVAEQLDYESVKALTERYLTRLAREVERYGGYVDQYIGDNVMAVFGAPTAHEDDPERAVRAAYGMQAAMAELNRTAAVDFGLELALRVGINTGEVLAGRIGTEYTVVGDAVNVAARLQSAAAVGRILVGDRTRRSTAAEVAYRQIGPLVLKGKADPVNAWEVVSVVERRLPRAPRGPLLGREAEMAELVTLCERAAEERLPALALLLGEPGVGKTRLVAELELRLRRRVPRMRFMHGQASSFGSNAAFEPLAGMLRAELGILREDSEQQAHAKLLDWLPPALAGDPWAAGPERRLAALLGLLAGTAAGADLPASAGDAEELRDSFFAFIRALVEHLSAESVPILVWDDFQWADEGTLELIADLHERVSAPLVQICIGREGPLERGGWKDALRRPASRISLAPLEQEPARELVATLLDGVQLGDHAGRLQEITGRCGGNPLFAEALVDRLAEAPEESHSSLPETVQSLLAARLDALGSFERRLLGHASVLGPTFTRASLERLFAAGESQLDLGLDRLCERNLIAAAEPRGSGGPAFTFRHALIREAAYEMLPKAVRARRHTAVGELLESRRGAGLAVDQGELAEHFTRAAALAAEVRLPHDALRQMRVRALRHGIVAGDAAAALFSNLEALQRYETAAGFAVEDEEALVEIAEKRGEVHSRLGHLEEAIAAWQSCIVAADAAEHPVRSAEIHRKIAAALAQRGERDAAVEQLQMGINLVKDRPPSLASARLFGEAATLYAQVGANMLAAYAAERALSYANSLGARGAASRAYAIRGGVFGRIGDVARARESLERAVDVVRDSDPRETAIALFAAAHSFETSECDYGAAQGRYEEALALAERVGDVPMQLETTAALARLALLGCRWDSAARGAELVACLAEQEGLDSMICLVEVLQGRLCWREGKLAAARVLLERAHQAAARNARPDVAAQALLWLAPAEYDHDDPAGGEAALERALAVSERAALKPPAAEACVALAALAARSAGAPAAAVHAEHALALSQQARDPVSRAAAAEAQGIASKPDQAAQSLDRASALWRSIGRPLESARCTAELAERMHELGDSAAQSLAAAAADAFASLGLQHLALRSRELGPV